MLSPLAQSVGLNFYVETLHPGNTPAQLAYGFVSCGGVLLVDSAEPEGVPSRDKGTRKHVAKALASCLDRQGAREAAVFLAQAYATESYEFMRSKGHVADAERHLGFRQLIQEHFPLSDDLVRRLETTRAEYRTLETREVRDEVRQGGETGTAYHQALLHPESLEGTGPNEDEELVRMQRLYAGTFLRGHARLAAIELTIGREAFAAVEDKLIFPGGPFGYEGLVFDELENVRWTSGGKAWQRHGKLAIGAAIPGDDDRDLALVGPAVARLRHEIVRWLETEQPRPLPERSQEAIGHFANEIATNEVGWVTATDALLMGYGLRVAERKLLSATRFDERIVARLDDYAASEPDMVLVGFALKVADRLPAAFGESKAHWARLSAWGGQRALDRAQARRNAGPGNGNASTLTVADCERAFGLGYSVRYVEEALDPGADETSCGPQLALTFDSLGVSSADVRSTAIDLLTRAEQIFVELGAPGPIGLLITRVSLKGRYNADEGHPQYGVLLGVTMFGYATRMAQAHEAPLPSDMVAEIQRSIVRDDQGTVDHEIMEHKPEALRNLGMYAGALADDRNGLLALLRTPVKIWTQFHRLATRQLYRNLKHNGIKRRLHPPPDAIENLIRFGCAVRIIEEVAGESPVLKSDLGLG